MISQLEHRGVVLEFWQKSLNLLTWTEILRQVSYAAGFGSKLDMTRKDTCSKVFNFLIKIIFVLWYSLLSFMKCHSITSTSIGILIFFLFLKPVTYDPCTKCINASYSLQEIAILPCSKLCRFHSL